MGITEQVASFLARKLGLSFEGISPWSVFFGYLPEAPLRAICVTGEDMRLSGDERGAKVRINIRAGAESVPPVQIAEDIARAMEGAPGQLLTDGGARVLLCETGAGFRFEGLSGTFAQTHSATFRIVYL